MWNKFHFKCIDRFEIQVISIQQIDKEKSKCVDFLIIKATHTERMTKPQLDR